MNKIKEIKKVREIELKARMNKSADCVGEMMERFIIGLQC